jgi:ABC-type branched-subunit amino acid transport system ATPase component
VANPPGRAAVARRRASRDGTAPRRLSPAAPEHLSPSVKGLAAQQKAVLLVDQSIKRALEVAVYVMRTGTVLSEGPRAMFGGDTEALVSTWLYASGNS